MALASDAQSTYGVTTIREDIHEGFTSLSPTETPFVTMAGSRNIKDTYHEWVTVDLAAVDTSNRVLEGEGAPANDAPTNGIRLGNFAQISDKVVEVSRTTEAVSGGVADLEKMAKQITFKMKELKRDMAQMLVTNVAANPGGTDTARVAAGLPTFLTTNVSRGATATPPTLSGTTTGYPNAAVGDGDNRNLTEAMLNTVIASCWDNGAEPTNVLCGSVVKQGISGTFTGSATRYKEVGDKKLSRAIDIYVSDFGELSIVPNRFQNAQDVFIVDPGYVKIGWLDKVKQKPLAETGHSERRLIWGEYTLIVDNEAAHGYISDITGVA